MSQKLLLPMGVECGIFDDKVLQDGTRGVLLLDGQVSKVSNSMLGSILLTITEHMQQYLGISVPLPTSQNYRHGSGKTSFVVLCRTVNDVQGTVRKQ